MSPAIAPEHSPCRKRKVCEEPVVSNKKRGPQGEKNNYDEPSAVLSASETSVPPPQREMNGNTSLLLSLNPPVTLDGFKDVEDRGILANAELRHDISFEPRVFVRPNLEGSKARSRKDLGNLFWRTLENQLTLFLDPVIRAEHFAHYGHAIGWCLPRLLRTVKDILTSITAASYRTSLEDGFNIELRMQEYYNGVFDLEETVNWLSEFLNAQWMQRHSRISEMARLVKLGCRTGDLGVLVQGLQELLTVVQFIKLDVVNYDIQCMRPRLVQDLVLFEKRFFVNRIQSGQLDVEGARQWYRRIECVAPKRSPCLSAQSDIFFQGLCHLVLPSTTESIPKTFLHDHKRLVGLREEVFDAVNLTFCVSLYREFEREVWSTFTAAASPRTALGVKTKVQQLVRSFVALHQTAPRHHGGLTHWKSIAPLIATEMFRYLESQMKGVLTIQEIDRRLSLFLCGDGRSDDLARATEEVHQKLLTKSRTQAAEFQGKSLEQLHRTICGRSGVDKMELDVWVDDIATRLAHLGDLHLRVWSEIAYT